MRADFIKGISRLGTRMALFPWRKKKDGPDAEADDPVSSADGTDVADATDMPAATVSDSAPKDQPSVPDSAPPLELEEDLDEFDLDEPEELRPLAGSLERFEEDEPLAPLGEAAAPAPSQPILESDVPPIEPHSATPEVEPELGQTQESEPDAVLADTAGNAAPADEGDGLATELDGGLPAELSDGALDKDGRDHDAPDPDGSGQDLSATASVEELPDSSVGLFGRLKRGLSKSRQSLAAGIGNLILGEREIDENALEDLETALLMADVGVDATRRIIDELTPQVERRELNNTDALFSSLSKSLSATLAPSAIPFQIDTSKSPFVILIVGVNGVGKTTTIGKLARRFQDAGHSVLLAAGDTFRAAAVEQLQEWGVRNDVTVVAQAQGSDSASVIFDAMEAAKARNIDIVLADTAGRLHNKSGLMGELEKIGRIMGRFEPDAPHEVLLVIDGGTGQNALAQVKEFSAAVDVTGLVVTKLDGTAKGGIVFAASEASKLPIYFIGVGEQIDDLRPFEPDDFVRALLDRSDE